MNFFSTPGAKCVRCGKIPYRISRVKGVCNSCFNRKAQDFRNEVSDARITAAVRPRNPRVKTPKQPLVYRNRRAGECDE